MAMAKFWNEFSDWERPSFPEFMDIWDNVVKPDPLIICRRYYRDYAISCLVEYVHRSCCQLFRCESGEANREFQEQKVFGRTS